MLNKHTIERLVIYNRVLKDLRNRGVEQVTSEKLGETLSKTPSQIRRDLSEVGKKGKPGVGYAVEELIESLDEILGLNSSWSVALVGAGNLGRALFYYTGFRKAGFEFRAVIDSDPEKTGKKWGEVEIALPSKLKEEVRNKDIDIGVIAVPPSAAQEVAGELARAGVKAILNFAAVPLNLPEDVYLRYADLAMDMENLSCHLSERKKK